MRIAPILAAILYCALLFSDHPLRAAEPIKVLRDVTYKKVDGQELKLDLARPDNDKVCPAIVFIHGGGWAMGERSKWFNQIQEAARQGYVAVTISYRLMKFDPEKKETADAEPHFPAQVHDVKEAVRWLRVNEDKYHIDPDYIGAMGDSAGGHLSLLLGLAGPEAELEGETEYPEVSSRVQAVVNYYGPTEMQNCFETSSVAWLMRLFMGGTPAEQPENYKSSSPLTHVSADDPPVLTFQGGRDRLVPVKQARMLDEKLKAAEVSHTLVVFPEQGHGFDQEHKKISAKQTVEFFEKHLKAPSQAN
ncbi:MAG: alpha/beta hydrolase [Planctomyces sp.]|nr:alpha/beta hydrolase [Planctomyces sp.]